MLVVELFAFRAPLQAATAAVAAAIDAIVIAEDAQSHGKILGGQLRGSGPLGPLDEGGSWGGGGGVKPRLGELSRGWGS